MASQTVTPSKARLIEVDGNPIPEGARVNYAETPDGMRLRYSFWNSEKRPTLGTVIILQGRAEYIEKYFETVTELRQRGFAVLCFDWRGQGGSERLIGDGSKGHVDHFDQYLTDLDTILTDVALPDCPAPFYLLAHSTGGLIALLAAPALGNRIRRMVLISPLLSLRGLPISQNWVQRIGGILSFLGFGRTSVGWGGRSAESRSFIGNNLTSDTKRFARNTAMLAKQGESAVSSPTVNWIFAACRAMDRINEPGYAGKIHIPTLLVAAGNDPVVAPQAVEKFGDKMRSGSFLTIFGSKHEILQERKAYREQFLSAFDAFIPGTDDDLKN
ncbi:alpha/beta fold hydrolase [Pseudahrensia aquimaris]|uniref:Alpha/beta fold hydrolase n=1 Tax=Pseudahrensia aquimaris TaxID=744461 RepID=A0ABW3FA76_9HYPH